MPVVHPDNLPFSEVANFLQSCSQAPIARKAKHLQAFRTHDVDRSSDAIFQIYRLLAPQLDRERDNYNLKEAKLATTLIKACGLDPRTNLEAEQATKWKNRGAKNAGNFAMVMEQHLFIPNCGRVEGTAAAKELTVGQLNERLDALAMEEQTDAKAEVLKWLIVHTTPVQMKWITQIILKDIKIGMTDTRLLRDFHPDAEALYNVTMDLRKVCLECRDPHRRLPRKDVEPGNSVRPQLADRANSPEDAFKKLKGRPFVAEFKFDGERIQVHRNGDDVKYFSRSGKEHGRDSYYNVMDEVIKKQLKHQRCILDGEMVVWNKTKKYFEKFGGLRTTVIAARDGCSPDQEITMSNNNANLNADPDYQHPMAQDLELVYITFDILYVQDQSVINRTLKERLALLDAAIVRAPDAGWPVGSGGTIKGRVLPLLPGLALLSDTAFSKIGTTIADIQDIYDAALSRQEEGIVLKALDSEWQLNDRSGNWLKVKPDYLNISEIDAVIIGGYMGTGRHGGKMAEFLLGLAEPARIASGEPSMFSSFCKVGTGFTDDERQQMREKLGRLLQEADGRRPPRCYRLSGKEKPDLWVTDPLKSIVVEVNADIRTIVSNQFATRYSLRFPRVKRIRWDKSPIDAMTTEELEREVKANKGAMGSGARRGTVPQEAFVRGGARFKKPLVRPAITVLQQFKPTDVSGTQVEVDLLQGAVVWFMNYAPGATSELSKPKLQALVKKLGGRTSENYTPAVRYALSVAHDAPIVKHTAKLDRCDIIAVEWLMDCWRAGELLPVRPRHYIHISSATHARQADTMDACGCPYFEVVEEEDLRNIMKRHIPPFKMLQTLPAQADEASTPARKGVKAKSSKDAAAVSAAPGPGAIDLVAERRAVVAELQAVGRPEVGFTALRGCVLAVVMMPRDLPPAAAPPSLLFDMAELQRDVDEWSRHCHEPRITRQLLEVQLHGGKVTDRLHLGVTHLVVVNPNLPQPIHTRRLLDAMAAMCDESQMLRHIRRALISGDIRVVDFAWVEDTLAAVEDPDVSNHRQSELKYVPVLVNADASGDTDAAAAEPASWPWAQLGMAMDQDEQEAQQSAGTIASPAAPRRPRRKAKQASTDAADGGNKRTRRQAPTGPRAQPARAKRPRRAMCESETEHATTTEDDGQRSQDSDAEVDADVDAGPHTRRKRARAGPSRVIHVLQPPSLGGRRTRQQTATVAALQQQRQGDSNGSMLEDTIDDSGSKAAPQARQGRQHAHQRPIILDEDDEDDVEAMEDAVHGSADAAGSPTAHHPHAAPAIAAAPTALAARATASTVAAATVPTAQPQSSRPPTARLPGTGVVSSLFASLFDSEDDDDEKPAPRAADPSPAAAAAAVPAPTPVTNNATNNASPAAAHSTDELPHSGSMSDDDTPRNLPSPARVAEPRVQGAQQHYQAVSTTPSAGADAGQQVATGRAPVRGSLMARARAMLNKG